MKIMFTSKDIQLRTIFVVNCLNQRNLRVSNGELLLEEVEQNKTLTKMPFQKILALFVIGHISITTPLIEKCKKYNVSLVVLKPNLRPVFYWGESAEANYLLRQRQHLMKDTDLSVAKALIENKICNQKQMLIESRRKDHLTTEAISICECCVCSIAECEDYLSIMGLEGIASKAYFSAFFQDLEWESRRPRTKQDPINVTLDIGYTILFNFIECFLRMYGFDLYIGVLHKLWFKRKSLVCDVMEPFRPIVDRTIRNAFHRRRFKAKDFYMEKGECRLKKELASDYYRIFVEDLISYKMDIFKFIQAYYRCFMRNDKITSYPSFTM